MIPDALAQLIARDEEVGALEGWLDDPWGRLALIEGEPGIGKTALWRHACSLAERRGYAVASASPAEAERHLVFAGLGDLVGPLLAEAADALSPPRRRAIESALLLDHEGSPPEERAVALAVLDVLRIAGRGRPLVIAIDDAHWLDGSSIVALAFAARRLTRDDAVATLVARRRVADDPSRSLVAAVDGWRRTAVHLSPLSLGATHQLYRRRLGLSLPRPRLVRIHEACGGNPFFALEIGRTLSSDPGSSRDELPIPPSLGAALSLRLAALSPAARHVTLLAAATAESSHGLLAAASGRDVTDAISEAVAAGVLVREGEGIRFEHPLLASAAYAQGSDEQRRASHRSLAGLVVAAEERARHLALSTAGPDVEAAAALDDAADGAEARGATAASAALREWAAEMTPSSDADAMTGRLVKAGYATFVSGDAERARGLLEKALAVGGAPLHEAHWRLALLLDEVSDWGSAGAHWDAALTTDDLALRVHVLRSLAARSLYGETVETAASHSKRAVRFARRLGDPRVLAHALATDGLVRTLAGDPRAFDLVAVALRLDPVPTTSSMEESPCTVAAECARLTMCLDEARDRFRQIHELAVGRGDFRTELWAAHGEAQVALDTGDWTRAQQLREAVDGLTEQSGLRPLFALRLGARLDAHRGESENCRALTERCVAEARVTGERLQGLLALAVLGGLELSEGNLEAAARAFEASRPIVAEIGIRAPGILRFLVDEAEALADMGRIDEAETAVHMFERPARALGFAWTLPLIDRARGLLAAARGDLEGAVELLREADAACAALPLPLERARVGLCLGRVLRRARYRAEARHALTRAEDGFRSLGSRLWVERTQAERARIGGRVRSDGLTPTEAKVAGLVAAGRTNKEVAASLFVASTTIEAHLSRIYAKLGIRSRTELALAGAGQSEGFSRLSADARRL